MWRVSGRCEESPRTLCLHIDDRMHVWKCEQGKVSGVWTCWDSRPSGILRDLGKVYTAEASLVVSETTLTRDLESGGEGLGAYTRHS